VRGSHIPAPGEHTGADLIDLLEDGRFRFRGRADRVIKVEGKRVSLPDVEGQLRQLPWIEAAAAMALDDPPTRLGAVVVLTSEGLTKLKDMGAFRFGRALRRELAAKQEPAGLPRQWRFVERLPAGTLGKLQRHELAALFAAPARERPTEPEICARRNLPDGVELDLHIPADLAQLEGHFPGRPVLAGVVQIDWAVMLASRYLGLSIAAAREFQVKFRTITTPEMQVTLLLRHLQAKRRLSFEYRADAKLLTSGSIALEAA
jgi:3-hydroxymyristoyl/3-hydroxydecanoyl-(acyl carrier protein) dehydratase